MRVKEALSVPGGLRIVYQPIFELRPGERLRPAYFECLARGPAGSELAGAQQLFAAAGGEGVSDWLDRLIVRTALEDLAPLPPAGRLAFNLDVETLESEVCFADYFLGLLAEHGVSPERTLIEIVEQHPITSPARVARAVHLLRRNGVLIAVDDVGVGHSNHRMLLTLRPELLKLDRYIVRGIASDRHRRAIASSLAHLALGFGGRLVAEGVETLSQLGTLRELGIELFQGYLLGRPTEAAEIRRRIGLEAAVPCVEPAPRQLSALRG